jgi:hypothetical protein
VLLSPLRSRQLFGLLYQPQMINDDDDDDDKLGAFDGIIIGRGNRRTRRKPAPVSLCPPQIPHDLTQARTRPPQWEAGD